MEEKDKALAVAQPRSLLDLALGTELVLKQTALIQEILVKVMKEDQHFGKIPGCGDKPVLLQAGAQKIAAMFNLHCEVVERHQVDLNNGHREVRFRVVIKANANGMVLGEGVATCTTMEKKYRYRKGSDLTITDKEVPKAFWDLGKENWKTQEAQNILGGPGRGIKKVAGKWYITIKGDKEPEEYHNPADYWNTIEKIGYKRAQVHAIINCTACSDIFEQDLEYLKELMEDDDLIEVGPAPYMQGSKPESVEQTRMDLDGKKESEPGFDDHAEKKEEKPPVQQPPPEEKPSAEETEKEPESTKLAIKGPSNKPVPAAPPKPTGDQKATSDYATFILVCFQNNIEQTITSGMLEECVGVTVEEGWSDKVVKELMAIYADISKSGDDKKEGLRKYFPTHY